MYKKYVVRLTADERTCLETVLTTGNAPARTQTHARILLKADCGSAGPAWTDQAIRVALDVGTATIERVRQALVLDGVEAALFRRRARVPRARKLDGAQEAHLVALTCSTPPAGHTRWTLQLLADRLVELRVVDGIAPETIRQSLKKTTSSRG